MAPSASFNEWNPSYTFDGSCYAIVGDYPVSATVSPQFNNYQPGDLVFTPSAPQGTWTTYDMQVGFTAKNQGWCPGYNLDVQSASVSISIQDQSNANDNFNWLQVSNTYTMETSTSGMGTYSWNVGAGSGNMNLGASYQPPSTMTPSYSVQEQYVGGGVYDVSTVSASLPIGGGSNSFSAILPLHILDWEMPTNLQWDHIVTTYTWTLTFAACNGWVGCGNSFSYQTSGSLGTFYTITSPMQNSISQWSYLEAGTVGGSVG